MQKKNKSEYKEDIIVNSKQECFSNLEDLSLKGKLISSNIEGNIITLVTQSQIVIYDICSGIYKAKINIISD